MITEPTTRLLLALIIPLVGAVLIGLSHRRPNQREAATLITTVLLALDVFSLLPEVLAGASPAVSLGELLPGIDLAFRIEPLGMLFACIASFLWIVTSVYSIGYMRGNDEQHQTRFYICFAIAISSVMGLAFSANMFTLFIFYEVLTLSTYPLVTHSGTPEAMRAGRTYLGLLLTTSIGFQLTAILWTYSTVGSLTFRLGGILPDDMAPVAVSVLLALYMFGIGKAALMPFHRWLPAAMVAPTPVSALLHAVAVVKGGVFTVVKVIVYIFGTEYLTAKGVGEWLIYVAGATVIIASIVALRQDHLKRRLAYSTISQLSYITLAAAVLAPLSIVGAAVHIAAPCIRQDHAVLCGRLDPHRRAQGLRQPARWNRAQDAVDHGRVRDRRAVDDWCAAGGRFHLEMVHAVGRLPGQSDGRGGNSGHQYPAERRVFPADRLSRFLQGPGRHDGRRRDAGNGRTAGHAPACGAQCRRRRRCRQPPWP